MLLFEVGTSFENKYYVNLKIKDMIERSFGKDGSAEVWIGLKTRAELTNNPNSHFTNFGEEEKIDGCAVMGIKGKWKIRSCSNLQPFVCEQILMWTIKIITKIQMFKWLFNQIFKREIKHSF